MKCVLKIGRSGGVGLIPFVGCSLFFVAYLKLIIGKCLFHQKFRLSNFENRAIKKIKGHCVAHALLMVDFQKKVVFGVQDAFPHFLRGSRLQPAWPIGKSGPA